jgi:outer membrane receptor for ferrienterochelin and colicins
LGGFVQNTFKATKWFTLESGLRLDYNAPTPTNPSNGIFLLPRINALFKLNEHFTSRIGGGLGYKMPNIFNDESEQSGYQYIKPFNIASANAERSYGGNADINFRGKLGDEATININQLFFYTYVDRPLLLQDSAFVSSQGHLTTQGFETNIKLVVDELVFYLGYTFTDTKQHFNGLSNTQPLTPKHQLNIDITYEIETSFRLV